LHEARDRADARQADEPAELDQMHHGAQNARAGTVDMHSFSMAKGQQQQQQRAEKSRRHFRAWCAPRGLLTLILSWLL
jgi:hypothetical protein